MRTSSAAKFFNSDLTNELPWAAGVAACLFYLAVHSAFYNFDGVACAIAVELADLPHLVHGNHMAYGLCGLGFYRLWQLLGYGGPALFTLQVFDSILGGAGIGVFFSLLLRLNASPRAAAAASAGLALSFAYWFWSLEAQVYLLGSFFILLAAREAFADQPRPARLGLWHALAALGHVAHLFFIATALYLLWSRSGGKKTRRVFLIYLSAFAAPIAAAYLAAGWFIVRPISWDQCRIWLLGSAALSADRSFLWHGGYSWMNFSTWCVMTLRLFTNPVAAGASAPLGWALGACAVAAAGLGLWARDRLAKAATLWISFYAALFITWEPFTIVYRITDLIPLWLLIAAAARRHGGRFQAALMGSYALSLGLYNWNVSIQPAADASRNADYRQAVWIREATPEDAWVAAVAVDQVYLPYFAHRKPLNLRYYSGRPQALSQRLETIARRGEPVFIASTALKQEEWRLFFSRYRLREADRRLTDVLYQVAAKGKPNGSR